MKFIMFFVFVACGALFSFSSANATLIAADKDAYVQSGANANLNFGNAVLDQVKRQDGSNFTRKSYIGFDLSGLSGEPITAATLLLNFVDSVNLGATLAGTNYTFELFGLTNEALDGWGESTITWANAPANQANNGLNALMAISLGTFDLVGKGIGEYAFSSQALTDFLNDDTNDRATFIVRRNTNQPSTAQNYVHAFASSESTGAAGPRLDIEQPVPAPEPSTLLLLGAGMAGLVLAKRKKKQ